MTETTTTVRSRALIVHISGDDHVTKDSKECAR
jgi:Cu/Zn superoxide dismutase